MKLVPQRECTQCIWLNGVCLSFCCSSSAEHLTESVSGCLVLENLTYPVHSTVTVSPWRTGIPMPGRRSSFTNPGVIIWAILKDEDISSIETEKSQDSSFFSYKKSAQKCWERKRWVKIRSDMSCLASFLIWMRRAYDERETLGGNSLVLSEYGKKQLRRNLQSRSAR